MHSFFEDRTRALVLDEYDLNLMKSKYWFSLVTVVGLLFMAFAVSAPAHPADKPHKHKGKGGKAVWVNPSGPGRSVVVKPSGRAPVVVRGGGGYVRYGGPRTRFVIRTGPWVGLTLLAAPYYYDYGAFNRYPVEVAVQIELQRMGYYNGPIDGDVGPMTHRAISRYQRDYGLAVTGTINRATLRSLGIY